MIRSRASTMVQHVTASPGGGQPHRWGVAYVVLGTISAVLSLVIQQVTGAHGITRYADIWFDMDVAMNFRPDVILPGIRHLLMGVVVNGPGAILAPIVQPLVSADMHAVTTFIAYIGVSISGGCSTVLLLAILRRLHISIMAAILIGLVDVLCLNRILIGSLAESFGYTALGLRACMLLCLGSFNFSRRFSFLVWVVLGTFCIGITLTNGMYWGICLLYVSVREVSVREVSNGLGQSLPRICAICVSTAVLTLGVSLMAAPLGNVPLKAVLGSLRGSLGVNTKWVQPLSTQRAEQVVYAFTDGFIAPPPTSIPVPVFSLRGTNNASIQNVIGNAVSYQWTAIHPRTARWQTYVLITMLILGASGLWQKSGPHRFVLISSALWLVFNLALNLKWGSDELFLYSLHWQCLTITWLAGLFSLRRIPPLAGYSAIGFFLAAQLWYNIPSVQEAIRLLSVAGALLAA